MTDPALEAWLSQMAEGGIRWADVQVQTAPQGYTLCHAADATRPPAELTSVPPEQLREIAQFTATGAFRPIKTAPNLRQGWVCQVATSTALREALRVLYPGSLADWYAVRTGTARPTTFRDYAARQSGMFRIAARLSEAAAAQVARACCAPRFCLKRRLWKVEGADETDARDKSDVPCLEPCALLLELARKTARLEQEPSRELRLSATEHEIVLQALDYAARAAAGPEREADFSSAANPRLAALMLERLQPVPLT